MTHVLDLVLLADAQSNAYLVGRAVGAVVGIALIFGVPLAFVLSIIFAFRTKHVGWIVATVVTGVLTLAVGALFIVGVVTGIRTAVATERHAASENSTLSSAGGEVSITAPEGWRKLDNLHEEALLQAGNGFREQYLIVLTDSKQDFAGTLEDHSATTVEGIVQNISDAEVSAPVSLTINGMPALQREIHGVVDNLHVEYLHTTVEGKWGYHQLLAWTLRSKRDTAFPVLREAVASFKENAPPKAQERSDAPEGATQGNAPPSP